MIFDIPTLIRLETAAFRRALDAEAAGDPAEVRRFTELAESYAADRAEEIRQTR